MSLALWRRFGTAAFVDVFGLAPRPEEADLPRRSLRLERAIGHAIGEAALDAAVELWREGRHACAQAKDGPQSQAWQAEQQAWRLGGSPASVRELEELEAELGRASPSEELARRDESVRERRQGRYDKLSQRWEVPASEVWVRRRLSARSGGLRLALSEAKAVRRGQEEAVCAARRSLVTRAGEELVRRAYASLLHGKHQSICDLWLRRSELAAKAMPTGGQGADGFEALRAALGKVPGYGGCGSPWGRKAGWELAFDIKTLTPLADDAGPVASCADYALWLRGELRPRLLRTTATAGFAATAPPGGFPGVGSTPLSARPPAAFAAAGEPPAGKKPDQPEKGRTPWRSRRAVGARHRTLCAWTG